MFSDAAGKVTVNVMSIGPKGPKGPKVSVPRTVQYREIHLNRSARAVMLDCDRKAIWKNGEVKDWARTCYWHPSRFEISTYRRKRTRNKYFL